ncbi:hypothetical protein HY642_03805 [Candidatus Woesearchaeota archaeon]|nr:hypothetical protein [Candidatus Woesearchaeota archaeon]
MLRKETMTLNTLGTPKPGNYDPSLVDRLNKEAADEARRAAEDARRRAQEQRRINAEISAAINPTPPIPQPARPPPLTDMVTGNVQYYMFHDIVYRGTMLPLLALKPIVDIPAITSVDVMEQWQERGWKELGNDWSVADAELVYQAMRRVCEEDSDVARHCRSLFKAILDNRCIATATTVRHWPSSELGPDHPSATVHTPYHPALSVKMPVFARGNLNGLVLAEGVGPSQLPDAAHDPLLALLGAGYESAGRVLQQCAYPFNGQVRSVIFHTPLESLRPYDGIVDFAIFNQEVVLSTGLRKDSLRHAVAVRIREAKA